MLNRVGEHDPLHPLSKEGEIADREKLFCNFTLLRAKAVTTLSEQQWMDFFDRRWRQYALCGFTFLPLLLSQWAAFWKSQTVRQTIDFHVKLPEHCAKVVSTIKQKLRDLAERSVQADTVCGSVPCGSVPWLVFSVRFLDRCSVLALITHGHARMLGSQEGEDCPSCKGEGVERG